MNKPTTKESADKMEIAINKAIDDFHREQPEHYIKGVEYDLIECNGRIVIIETEIVFNRNASVD